MPNWRSNSDRRGEDEAKINVGKLISDVAGRSSNQRHNSVDGGSLQLRSKLHGLPLRALKGGELGGKGVVGEDGLGVLGVDVLIQFDPGFATAKTRGHRQFDALRETENADREGVDLFGASPIEALGDDVIAPDVLAAEVVDGLGGVEEAPICESAEIFEAESFGDG